MSYLDGLHREVYSLPCTVPTCHTFSLGTGTGERAALVHVVTWLVSIRATSPYPI
jgi:hypothetical protein